MDEIYITIKTYNQAFSECPSYEVAEMLRKLADEIQDGERPINLMDKNGNKVGRVEYKQI